MVDEGRLDPSIFRSLQCSRTELLLHDMHILTSERAHTLSPSRHQMHQSAPKNGTVKQCNLGANRNSLHAL